MTRKVTWHFCDAILVSEEGHQADSIAWCEPISQKLLWAAFGINIPWMFRTTTSGRHWMYKECVCICMHPLPPHTHTYTNLLRKGAQDTRKHNLGHLLWGGGTNLASGLWLQMPGINRAGPSDWQTLGCQHPLHSQEFKFCFCHDLVVWPWVTTLQRGAMAASSLWGRVVVDSTEPQHVMKSYSG